MSLNLSNTTKNQRMNMATRGENVEALIALNEPEVISELISRGHAQNHYDEWKTHEHGDVRYALAHQGYYPETLIDDKNPNVREAVVRWHPEYRRQLLARNKKRHWEFICKLINEETELAYIKDFLDAKVPKTVNKQKLRAIRTLYALKTTEPTTVEKTMTPTQLFQTNSPFWAQNLELWHIEDIQALYSQVQPEAFLQQFNDLIDPDKYYKSGWQLRENYSIE